METLKDILAYHVVAGEFSSADLSDGMMVPTIFGGTLDVSMMDDAVMINNVTIATPDIDASNGVIHVIDKVLIPDSITIPTLIDLGKSTDLFESLVDALTAAELVDALSAPGPFTLFAPTEAGFDALPAGALEALTTAEDKTPLTKILKYHVVPELISREAISEGLTTVTTLQGNKLTLSLMGMGDIEQVKVNGVLVQGTTVAGNGIVYSINEVLSVPDDTETPTATPTATPTTSPTIKVDVPTMAPNEDSGALSTSSFVASMFSGLFFAFELLMN